VEGPCPKCKGWVEAAAIGGSVPVDALAAPAKPTLLALDYVTPETRVVAVLVECNCGYNHSEKGATGCGRIWGVACPEEGEPVPMPASRLDFSTQREVTEAEGKRLSTARTRAEKWIPGVTALAGLLTTVLVLKGPESVSKLDTTTRTLIAVLLGIALVLLIAAIRSAYSAAFGSESNPEEVPRQPVSGLHARVLRARRSAEATAKKRLGVAITLTVSGVLFIAAAVALSWFPLQQAQPEGERVCVLLDGEPVVEVAGSSLAVKEQQEGYTIGPCD
jgi:hypothetical protein